MLSAFPVGTYPFVVSHACAHKEGWRSHHESIKAHKQGTYHEAGNSMAVCTARSVGRKEATLKSARRVRVGRIAFAVRVTVVLVNERPPAEICVLVVHK